MPGWKLEAGATSPAEVRSLPAPPGKGAQNPAKKRPRKGKELDGFSVAEGNAVRRRIVVPVLAGADPAGHPKAVQEMPV